MQTSKSICVCVVRYFCCSIYVMLQRAIKHKTNHGLLWTLFQSICWRTEWPLCSSASYQQPSPHLSHNMTCRKYEDFLSILPQYFTAGRLTATHDHLTNMMHIIVGMTAMIMNALSSPAIVWWHTLCLADAIFHCLLVVDILLQKRAPQNFC